MQSRERKDRTTIDFIVNWSRWYPMPGVFRGKVCRQLATSMILMHSTQ